MGLVCLIWLEEREEVAGEKRNIVINPFDHEMLYLTSNELTFIMNEHLKTTFLK